MRTATYFPEAKISMIFRCFSINFTSYSLESEKEFITMHLEVQNIQCSFIDFTWLSSIRFWREDFTILSFVLRSRSLSFMVCAHLTSIIQFISHHRAMIRSRYIRKLTLLFNQPTDRPTYCERFQDIMHRQSVPGRSTARVRDSVLWCFRCWIFIRFNNSIGLIGVLLWFHCVLLCLLVVSDVFD